MIHRDDGELMAECDSCGEEFAGGVLEWSEFIASLKEAGWRIRKVEDSWEHYCDECSEESV